MNYLIVMIQQYGVGFVFLNVLALQAGLPVPAYPALIVAGAYAAMGGRPLWQLVVVGIAAALVADTGWYLAGRKFGVRILGTLCKVSGARTIDMQKIAEGFEGIPVDGEVIVYCACPNEATAVKVAQVLRKVGFKRIRPLHGGIDAWIQAGHAVEH
jgi:rhodanese-related sulfurtransferase